MGESPEEFGIPDLLREEWLDEGCKSVWVSAFRAILPAEKVPTSNLLDLQAARVAFIGGSITYQAIEMEGSVLDKVQLRPQKRETPWGTYVLIMTPFAVGGEEGNETQARRVVEATAGLISAINGGGLIFEFVFENIIGLVKGELTGFTRAMKTSIAFGSPKVSAQDFEVTTEAAKAMAGLGVRQRERFALALYWQHKSVRARDGRNEFVALWTGLEALAMPNTSNVKPANELLASAYGLPVADVTTRFGLGRLQNLRSKILHGEALPNVHGDLVNYLRAIFADVLLEVLGLPSQGRAQAYLEEPLFGDTLDLNQLLNIP